MGPAPAAGALPAPEGDQGPPRRRIGGNGSEEANGSGGTKETRSARRSRRPPPRRRRLVCRERPSRPGCMPPTVAQPEPTGPSPAGGSARRRRQRPEQGSPPTDGVARRSTPPTAPIPCWSGRPRPGAAPGRPGAPRSIGPIGVREADGRGGGPGLPGIEGSPARAAVGLGPLGLDPGAAEDEGGKAGGRRRPIEPIGGPIDRGPGSGPGRLPPSPSRHRMDALGTLRAASAVELERQDPRRRRPEWSGQPRDVRPT